MAKVMEIPQTPAIVIDDAIVMRNLARMGSYAAQHGIGLRPHTKTHKSILMAKRQMAGGAIGLTAAKVGEAEMMSGASKDLLLAYPAVDGARCERLAVLAKENTVRVAVDSREGLEALGNAAARAGISIGILVDLDVGMRRTGVQSPAASLDLTQSVSRSKHLRLDGLFIYPGHVFEAVSKQQKTLELIDARVEETLELWSRSGMEAKIVSGGSTPTAFQSHLIRQLTEIRPGTYIYNDMNTVLGGFCTLDDCAARIVCTVVSDAVPGKFVVDAGSKTLTSDRNAAQPDSGFGFVVEYPKAKVLRLTEEHGEVDASACEKKPCLGERVHVIPNHICPCVNLQDSVWLRGDDGSLRRLKIDARGRLF